MLGYLRDRLSEAKEKGNMNGVLVKNFNMWRQSSEESIGCTAGTNANQVV